MNIPYAGIFIKKLMNMGSWDLNQVPLKCLSHLLSQWAVDASPFDSK
jgi:hypothetical protein